MSNETIRPDGRQPGQLRELKIEVGVLERADGSSRVNLGKNLAIASVFGPRELHPKHSADANRGKVRVNYRMATFSVTDYKRSFPSRREREISKVLSEAFEGVVLTKAYPRSSIDVHIQIFESDGGTRTAAAIAVSAALADAGVPMRDLAAGIASGIYEDTVVLDMTGIEDMKGTGDMPLMYSPATDEISLFQLDGLFTYEQFKTAFDYSINSVKQISETIKEALKKRYLAIRDEIGIADEDTDVLEEEEAIAETVVKTIDKMATDPSSSVTEIIEETITQVVEVPQIDTPETQSEDTPEPAIADAPIPEATPSSSADDSTVSPETEEQDITESSKINEDNNDELSGKEWYDSQKRLTPMGGPSLEEFEDTSAEDQDVDQEHRSKEENPSEDSDKDVMRDIEYSSMEDDSE